jgi:hypothetical protein
MTTLDDRPAGVFRKLTIDFQNALARRRSLLDDVLREQLSLLYFTAR